MVRGAGCKRLPYLLTTITSLHNPSHVVPALRFTLSTVFGNDGLRFHDAY